VHIGLFGAIAGCVIGMIGGAVGTYLSVKRTNGPRERAFMLKWSFYLWLFVMVFLALLLVLPPPYRLLLWIPYIALLPFSIIRINRGQARIRAEEKTLQTPESS
jgi:hypothetical protein